MAEMVDCQIHGTQQRTFVCQHIVESLHTEIQVGFFWANDPDNPRPDAWCMGCEEWVQKTEGEWTGEALEHLSAKLLCEACYDIAKEKNLGADS